MGNPRPRRHTIYPKLVRRTLPWLAVLGTAALTAECADPAHAAPAQSVDEVKDIIRFWGNWWHADVALLLRVAYRESKYDPNAYNPRGPYLGLFQFHPNTWAWMSRQAGAWSGSAYEPEAAAFTAAWAFTHTDARGRPLRLHWPTAY